jgi:hypothetical protein
MKDFLEGKGCAGIWMIGKVVYKIRLLFFGAENRMFDKCANLKHLLYVSIVARVM